MRLGHERVRSNVSLMRPSTRTPCTRWWCGNALLQAARDLGAVTTLEGFGVVAGGYTARIERNSIANAPILGCTCRDQAFRSVFDVVDRRVPWSTVSSDALMCPRHLSLMSFQHHAHESRGSVSFLTIHLHPAFVLCTVSMTGHRRYDRCILCLSRVHPSMSLFTIPLLLRLVACRGGEASFLPLHGAHTYMPPPPPTLLSFGIGYCTTFLFERK